MVWEWSWRKIVMEVEDERRLQEIVVERLEKMGFRVKVEPDPEAIRAWILDRWRRPGRRARPGELAKAGLEEEFSC
ncbi:MAG: hypothetical protein F7C38_02745 [Desulfurococcales archaeon]|nr:hypothetical protein [Desulfurococcales archaeon]